jgi:single-stranded-DNA-specific exonuclease
MKFNLAHENFKEDYGRNLLLARGVKDIEHFLKPDESCIQSPFDLDYMERGVELLHYALVDDAPTFALVVDSDVDGFTSSSIIYQYIKLIRPDAFINYYLHEGKQHGLSDVVEKIIDDNEKS